MSWIIPTKKINSDFSKPLDVLIKEKSLEALSNAPKLVTNLTSFVVYDVPSNQYFSILELTGGGTIDKIFVTRGFAEGTDYSMMYTPKIFIDGYEMPVSTSTSTLHGWDRGGTGFVHLMPTIYSRLHWQATITTENYQTNSSHNLNLNFSKRFQLDIIAPSEGMGQFGIDIMYSLYT